MLRTAVSMLGVGAVIFLLCLSPLALVPATSAVSGSSRDQIVPASLIIALRSYSVTCSPNGLCPSMLDKAYGFNDLHGNGTDGAGQTIVIDDACGNPTMVSDLKTFDSQFGLRNPKLNIIYVQGKKHLCSDAGWALETALDVEWSHVVAPNATIDLLVASQGSKADVYGAWAYALSKDLGNQISNSWGGAGCGTTGCNNTIGQGIGPCGDGSNGDVVQLLQEAAKDHVTVVGAAGDDGAWGQGTDQGLPVPMDCKGVLTVGGTTLDVSSTGAYEGETAWSGTGGGYSTTPEPAYQTYAQISDPYNSLGKPDVAAVADPDTGVWIYNEVNGGWFVIGGTSVATPLWAGFMADVNQIRAVYDFQPAGFINPFLYTTVYGVNGGSSLYSKDFHDITQGNNGWPAGAGWDPDTGLGSFIGPNLATTLGTNQGA